MPRELQPCGTQAAYRRHLRHREVSCVECCAAQAESQRKRRGEPTVRGRYRVQGCGTNAGYHQHRRRKEEPCRPCLDAMGAYLKQRRLNLAAGGGR